MTHIVFPMVQARTLQGGFKAFMLYLQALPRISISADIRHQTAANSRTDLKTIHVQIASRPFVQLRKAVGLPGQGRRNTCL